MSCPSVSALKKKVIEKVVKKYKSLDKKKFPFELTKKNLTKEINKVKSKEFLNTLGSAENSCAIRGGRYGKRGGGLITWLLYCFCVLNEEEDFIGGLFYEDCYDMVYGDDAIAATPAVSPAAQPEVVTAAAPSAAPSSAEDLYEAYSGSPTPEEVDAMSSEDYANYINSLGGGRRKRKSRKKRRKTKRKSHKKRRKTKRRGKNSRKKRGKGNSANPFGRSGGRRKTKRRR